MNGNYLYADVDLPFHVWVRESGRWVLREAPGARGSRSPTTKPGESYNPSQPEPTRPSTLAD